MKSYLHWYWFFKFLQSPPFWHTTSLHSSTSEKLYDKFELISLIYGISFEGQVPPPGNRLTLFLPKMGLQCQSLQSFKHCYQKDVYLRVFILISRACLHIGLQGPHICWILFLRNCEINIRDEIDIFLKFTLCNLNMHTGTT